MDLAALERLGERPADQLADAKLALRGAGALGKAGLCHAPEIRPAAPGGKAGFATPGAIG